MSEADEAQRAHRILSRRPCRQQRIRPKALSVESKRSRSGERASRSLKQAVADIVARQASAGIDIVNDGEFGKSGWANYVLERITGFEPRPDTLYPAVWLGRDRIRFADFMAAEFPRGVTGTPGHACVGPIEYRGQRASGAISPT